MFRGPGIISTILATTFVGGCASVPQKGGFTDVEKLVNQRTGLQVQWDQGKAEDHEVKEAVLSLLQQPLSADAAVQVALLSNASLQATFEDLGIAQADLVQAGLLQNPILASSARWPDHPQRVTNSEFAVAQNFLDLLILPLRKRLAAVQFEQAKLRVSDAVLQLTAEVRTAYYTLQGAEQVQAMRQTIFQAAEAANELAERQHQAGNINDLELATEQSAFQQAKLDLTQSEIDVQLVREQLHRLMGFLSMETTWRLVEHLPELPSADPSSENLETLALSQRLDLAAARKSVDILKRTLTVTRAGIVPAVNVGVDTEHDLDHAWVTGPTLELELPIFDQKQAVRARAKAQLRQAQHQLEAMEATVRSEVRSAQTRLRAARQTAEFYRNSIIPTREQIVAETQKHYNFMLMGTFQLLQAKRDEVNAYREYLLALRDYWIAFSELERSVGGNLSLPTVEPTTTEQEPATSQEMPMEQQEHHHGDHP